jgi:hypothetical protein
MPVVQESVRAVHEIGDPRHLRLVSLQPSPEKIADRRLVGKERNEVEAAPESQVDQGDRPIRRVHGAEHEKVGRQGEPVVRVLEAHLLPPIFEEEVQLAEDLRQIAAIDLVDDQENA